MIEQAREAVNALRMLENCKKNHTACSDCPQYYFGGKIACHPIEYVYGRLADLIESLSAELEQVKRERDAAVKDLTLWGCFSCKHAGYAHSEVCASCLYNRNRIAKGYVSGKNRYEWRGVKEDSK